MFALKKRQGQLQRQLPIYCQWLRQCCCGNSDCDCDRGSNSNSNSSISNNSGNGGGKQTELCRHSVFKLYNLETGPVTSVALTIGEASQFFGQMQRIRWLEHALVKLYEQRALRGLRHVHIGQEALAVGIRSAMRAQDMLIATHRPHVWASLMGVSIRTLLSELISASPDCCRRGATCMRGPKFLGSICMTGGVSLTFGVGVALSQQYSFNGGVCLTVFDANATKDANVLEIYKLAKERHLPLVLVCENFDETKKSNMNNGSKASNYCMHDERMPALWVDGNEVLAVRNATQFAIEYAQEHGPIFLELYTRVERSYRTKNNIRLMRQECDPIATFAEQIIALDLIDEVDLLRIEMNMKRQIDVAVERVLADKQIERERTEYAECKTTTDNQCQTNFKSLPAACQAFVEAEEQMSAGLEVLSIGA